MMGHMTISDLALIAFVRAERDAAAHYAKEFGKGAYSERADLFTALLSRLEGRPHEDDSTRIGQPDVTPTPQHAATDTKGQI